MAKKAKAAEAKAKAEREAAEREAAEKAKEAAEKAKAEAEKAKVEAEAERAAAKAAEVEAEAAKAEASTAKTECEKVKEELTMCNERVKGLEKERSDLDEKITKLNTDVAKSTTDDEITTLVLDMLFSDTSTLTNTNGYLDYAKKMVSDNAALDKRIDGISTKLDKMEHLSRSSAQLINALISRVKRSNAAIRGYQTLRATDKINENEEIETKINSGQLLLESHISDMSGAMGMFIQ